VRIVLEESHVAVTGTFKRFGSTDQVVSRLIAAGARSAGRSRTPEVDVVVWGRSNGNRRVPSGGTRDVPKMVRQLRRRGLPVLDEAQLVELLERGVITVDEEGLAPRGAERLSGLLGQARSLLDGAPSSGTWTEIVRLVESCEVGERGALVDYLAPQLARWRAVEPHARWSPAASDPLRAGLPAAFFDQLPWGMVRVAHPRWVYDAIEDRGARRLELAEFVGMAGLDPSPTDALALFGSSALSGLRGLDLTSMPVGSIAWEKVAERAAWGKLESLTLEGLDAEARASLERSGLFHGVRRVCMRSRYPYDIDGFARTLASEVFDEVEEVVVEGLHAFEGLARALRASGALPSLETLTLASTDGSVPLNGGDDAIRLVLERVERLRIVCGFAHPWFITHLCAQVFDGLEVLDLSGFGYTSHERGDGLMQVRRMLQARLPGSVLVSSLERIELGRLATAPLVDRLWADGVGVEGW
jgi:hypothetical protein